MKKEEEEKKRIVYMNRNESERRQTKKRNTLSLSEINNKYTMFFSVLIFLINLF